jgi:hypothetical protein
MTLNLSSGRTKLSVLVLPLILRQDKQKHGACMCASVNVDVIIRGFWFLPSTKALRETHIRVYGTDRNLSALRRRCLMVLVCFQVVDLKLIYSMRPYRFRDMIVAMSMSRQSVVYMMHSCSLAFCLKVVMQVALASEVILLLRSQDFRTK